MRHAKAAAAAIALGLAAGGCSSAVAPNPLPELVIMPIHINRVDVQILESVPPRASAHVEGVIGDGCAELNSESQARFGNTVTITILSQRPRKGICPQIAKLYRKDIPLEGTFPPGDWLLRVNGVDYTFVTQ